MKCELVLIGWFLVGEISGDKLRGVGEGGGGGGGASGCREITSTSKEYIHQKGD